MGVGGLVDSTWNICSNVCVFVTDILLSVAAIISNRTRAMMYITSESEWRDTGACKGCWVFWGGRNSASVILGLSIIGLPSPTLLVFSTMEHNGKRMSWWHVYWKRVFGAWHMGGLNCSNSFGCETSPAPPPLPTTCAQCAPFACPNCR